LRALHLQPPWLPVFALLTRSGGIFIGQVTPYRAVLVLVDLDNALAANRDRRHLTLRISRTPPARPPAASAFLRRRHNHAPRSASSPCPAGVSRTVCAACL